MKKASNKKPTELVPWIRETRPRVRGKKRNIIQANIAPPPRTMVICVDEIGPIAVKTYPGEELQQGSHRATYELYYGRCGKIWVHGAFEPATGQASILMSPGRDSFSQIQLLEKMMTEFPFAAAADCWSQLDYSYQSWNQTCLSCLAWNPYTIHSQVCMLAQPDWAVVETVALLGAHGQSLRNFGWIDGRFDRCVALLECSSISLLLEEEPTGVSFSTWRF